MLYSIRSGLSTRKHSAAQKLRTTPLKLEDLEARRVLSTYIVNSLDDVLDTTITTAHMTLPDAVSLANSASGSNSITFDPALTKNGSATFTLTAPLNLTGNFAILGPTANQIILSAPNISNVAFTVASSANIDIENLEFTNFSTPVQNLNGSLVSNAGVLKLGNCTFYQNIISANGSLINNSGNLTLTSSSFTSNLCIGTFDTCIYSTSNILISDSTFYKNQTNLRYALEFASGHAAVANCTLFGNLAESGGTIEIDKATVTITNSTIVNNASSYGGFAITSYTAFGIYNSIIAGNSGGGSGHDYLTDTNINGPVSSTSSNNITSSASMPDGNNNIFMPQVYPLGEAIEYDNLAVLFGNNPTLQNNGGPTETLALIPNSLALGHGSTQVPNYVNFDQRGVTRAQLAPDIGAYQETPTTSQTLLSTYGVATTPTTLFAPTPAADSNTAFVQGLYNAVLKRSGDTAGITALVADLNSGVSRQTLAYALINSTENRTNEVETYYQTLLNRAADPTGLKHFVAMLQNGANESDVVLQILSSQEFLAANNNTQLVSKLYQLFLGRTPDVAGSAGWVNTLNQGKLTPAQVARNILFSNESLNLVIQSDFNNYLERSAEPGAVSGFENQLQNGRMTFGTLQATILASGEFFADATAQVKA